MDSALYSRTAASSSRSIGSPKARIKEASRLAAPARWLWSSSDTAYGRGDRRVPRTKSPGCRTTQASAATFTNEQQPATHTPLVFTSLGGAATASSDQNNGRWMTLQRILWIRRRGDSELRPEEELVDDAATDLVDAVLVHDEPKASFAPAKSRIPWRGHACNRTRTLA